MMILNSFLTTDKFFDNPCIFFKITGEERIECMKKLLRLDHLNQEEYEYVERLIINSIYVTTGHIIDKNGVRPDPKKIIAVKEFPVPKTQKNVKQLLGLAGYYRRFIEGF